MAVNRESVVATAEKLVARGKIEGAIKEYRKLVADNPSDAMTINRLGDLYVRISRNEEAVKLFLQIAERYTEDGFFVKAIAIFKKIIKLDPTRLPVYERLAELYHKQGLVTEARTQYQVLVDYYLKHGKIESAEGVLRKMTALDSGDPTPHVKLAEIFRDRGEHDKELHEYRLLAEMMLRHKRIDEAAQVYAKAIAAAPQDLGFITDAVLGLKDAGHLGAAAKLLAIAVEKNPQAEKIARIAGIGERRRGEVTGVHRMVEETPPRVLKVSDVAPVPPELRASQPVRLEPPRAESSKPSFLLEEIEVEFPQAGDGPSTEVHPTFEVLRSIADATSETFAEPAEPVEESGVDFVLEIEGFEESAAPAGLAAAPPATDSRDALFDKPMVSPPPAPPTDIDWSFEPEPDLVLDLDLPPAAPPAPSAPAPAPARAAAAPEALRAPAQEPQAVPPARRLADLLAEAEVFRKHGLSEKAHDRIRTILAEDPRQFEAMALAIALFVEAGKLDRALTRAQQLERLAQELPAAGSVWQATRARLEKAGFRFEGDTPVAVPPAAKPKKDSIGKLLDELSGLAAPTKGAAKPRSAAKAEPDLAALVDGLAAEVQAAAPPPAPAAEPRARAVETPDYDLEVTEVRQPPVQPPAEAPVETELDEAAIEDRLSWLDEAAERAKGKSQKADEKRAGADALFEDEEGFFDLAAELEEELSKEEIGAKEVIEREEPSLEEIVEGFKKGVAESLSPEDYDTHFNLGIAYREMGLIDEAIGEFQLASKHENYLLDCCSLLGGCFLEKGLPELGIKWFQRGLAQPNLAEEANLGLLYDLGNLYFAIEDYDNARRTFIELYGVNSNYRDVVAKLEELGSR
jgi:tetratricopeptide (TPR) repeat protein